MITHLGLKNFKRFHSLELPVTPLTVLTGANGAGKTSLIHALLLARQAALSPAHQYVDLNGPFGLALGDAIDVLNRDSQDQSIQVSIVEDGAASAWGLSLPGDERALNLQLTSAPVHYAGVLAALEPKFTYLCAERFGPRDVLGAKSLEPGAFGVGVHGELTGQALAVHERMKVSDGRTAPSEKSLPPSLLHQTEFWMQKLVGAIQIQAEWFPGTTVTRLRFRSPGSNSEWMRAPNVGFGVSYALPVVVAGLIASNAGLFIVENPEAHLHPAGQSQIGEFLAIVAADGTQVLLETHSDHVVNGIRRAVANKSARLSPDNVSIHFVRDSAEQNTPVTTISLSETGSLSSWPSGFFDQIERDLAQLATKTPRQK